MACMSTYGCIAPSMLNLPTFNRNHSQLFFLNVHSITTMEFEVPLSSRPSNHHRQASDVP